MAVVAETRSGRVEGLEEGGVRIFRGIPFARPPVGALRLRAPEREASWGGVRPAQVAGPAAPQNGSMLGALLGLPPAAHDEDCLTLNVLTPAVGTGRRPVLVWIHGGGFVFGAGSQPTYESLEMVRRGDVVLVTIHYRLGALGWLAHPGLAADDGVAGNFGLLDQVAALEWVRDSIEAFGGDPGCVTVFGESAGAMSVGTLLATPRAQGLFRRAILQSGACHNAAPMDVAEKVAEIVLKELGLEPHEVRRLRDVPCGKLLEAQVRAIQQAAPLVRGIPFQPTIDGVVVPQSPIEAVAEGACADVDVLVGTNADEWKLFGLQDQKARNLDDTALLSRLGRTIPGRDAAGRSHAARALETYRNARRRAGLDASASEIWFATEGDRFFGVPALRLAEARADAARPVYRYLFQWRSPALGGALGACHALEIPFVFGSVASLPALRGFVGEGEAVERLSRCMQDAWLAFAREGDPSHEELGPWPRFEPLRAPTMLFDAESGVAEAPHAEELGFWRGLL